MSGLIPYGRQNISEADIRAVADVLRSDFITQGPMIERFEQAVAAYCAAAYAVAVSSATAGLHLACLAAGLGEGDILWTVPTTFVASANCGRYCGADVDFVDIDPKTYTMSVDHLAQKLEVAEKSGRLPKVVVPVHLAGQACPMDRIGTLSRRYGFRIIEDAAHAIGGNYQGQKIGSCAHADMAVFSFHPVKIITTGEGGMVLTNREDLYQKLCLLRSHGITRDPARMDPAIAADWQGPWYYQQIELGFNDRMTDIQAALGLSQMARVDEFVARRRTLARRYDTLLRDLPLTLPWQHPETDSAWHLYIVRLKPDPGGPIHRQVFEALRAVGIGVNLHYIPVHTQPYYQRLGFRAGDFPEAERYAREVISLPLYFDLSESDQDRVVAALRTVLAGCAV